MSAPRSTSDRSRLASFPYRAVVELSSLPAAQRRLWSGTTRKLIGAFIVLALVDLNSSHVRDVVRGWSAPGRPPRP